MHRNCILFLFLLLPIILCDAAPQKDHSRNRIRRKGRPGVYCREPGVPAHGSSLYNSIQAGAIVVHSCDPGYMLVGAKLRLCQTNGQWSPSIPNCILVDCGDPGEPTNGAKWVANTFLGSVAKYTCDKGFTLSGNLMRVCQRTGRWSGSLPSCVGRSCRDLPPPANGNVFIQDNRVGSLATYSCSSGFTLIGNRTRVCGSDGIWRGRPPICRRVSCGQLGAPEKGRVNLGGLTVGSIATYECFQGYTLVGVSTRTCQPNGQWTGRQPFCQGRNCARLVDIQNGRVSFSSTSVGSVATYICNQGFELIGSSRRTCQSNGQWSGREPVCTGLRCGSLSNIENGRVSFPSTSVGSVATYTCNRGFELIGSSRRTCQSNGQWSGREPVCTGLRCRSLSNIENGRVSFSSTSVGSVATYTCNRGFELIGSSRRTCQSNRQWSSVEPFCRIIGCERLQPPLNGVVSFPSTTLGSVAVYSCNRGFELVGVARRTCQIDGTWSGIAPTCSADVKRCSTLSNPSNGQVFVTGTSPSSLATYICNRGFTLQGNRNRVCQATGLWSGEEPTCTRSGCSGLDSPINGQVSLSGTFVGSLATYSCNQGFSLVGVSIRVCLVTGQWSASAPTCERVECDNIRAPDNGVISFSDSLKVNSVATYSCNSGFLLVGIEARICQANGAWSGSAPSCKRVPTCPVLDPPKDGLVSQSGTSIGDTATYSCILGFELVGNNRRTCVEPGQWSGAEPSCRRVSCGRLPTPANGDISYSRGLSFGSVATYSCDPPHQLTGSRTRVCGPTGTWSGVAPVCTAPQCPSLTAPPNGFVSVTGTVSGSVATYSCQRGFSLVGSQRRTCRDNGVWSGVTPLCQPSGCQDLKPPDKGDVQVVGSGVGARATYTCISGYELDGDEYRTCRSNGEWSGQEPTCKAVDCGPLRNPVNGRVTFTSTKFRSSATYTCDSGLVLFGKGIRACQANGRWEGRNPECKVINCGSLRDPPNGRVFFQGSTFGLTATYSCDPAFTLVGSSSRICGISGEWSGSEPECKANRCPDLAAPENGRVEQPGNSFGDVAVYSCNPGFSRVGPVQRTCMANGKWSSVAATCKRIQCKSLVPPAQGRIGFTNGNNFGSVATYTCNEGYNLGGGGRRRTCRVNGHWSGIEPFCEVVECGTLKHPTNGAVTLTGLTFSSRATYSCFENYILQGAKVRDCLANGNWSGSMPTCRFQPFDCGQLEPPLNGRVTVQGTTAGSIATYSCNRGFFPQGGNEIHRCIANLGWDGRPPKCQPVDCGILVPPLFGRVSTTQGSTFGSVATYTCNEGHRMEGSGSTTRRCQETGEWSGRIPICIPVKCEELTRPRNGVMFVTGITFGSTVTYNCNVGFELVGVSSRTCQSNGVWSDSDPTCRRINTGPGINCGDPGVPSNGRRTGDNFGVRSTVTYQCNRGFVLVGSSSRTCQESGQWSGSLPTCKISGGGSGSGQCSPDGDTVVDNCGQRCTCRQGRYTDCCRLRPDFASLSKADRLRYINAVRKVSSDPRYKPRYDALVSTYTSSFNTLAHNTKPKQSQFLVWNRYYLIQYENLLREVDCRITIPYWDWTALPLNPYMSPVFDATESGFGDSSRGNDSCVTNGAFNVTSFQVTASASGGCLKREYKLQMFPTRAIIEQDVLTRPANEFNSFHHYMQIFLFTNVRCFVGGQMCSNDAANDPLFLLHISNIDFIFTRWQSIDISRLNARYQGDNTTLVLSSRNATVSDFANNQNLLDGVRVCYGHLDFKSHIPTSMAFLSDALLELTNNRNLKMECAVDEMKKMNMGESETKFMNEKCKKKE